MEDLLLGLTLIVATTLAGRVWVLLPQPLGRALGWLSLVGGMIVLFPLDREPLVRMVVYCCYLLGSMKSLVYVEWGAKGRRLQWSRYLVFAFLWLGMEPGEFARDRRKLRWTSHLQVGLSCVMGGTLGALLARALGWTNILILFVPMSIAFHYGALRLLACALRISGFPVRTLFRNPLATTGLGDFWGARWNLGYAHMMARTVLRPSERILGPRMAFFVVFLFSGLLHEVAITLPVGMGYGLPTLYFVIQALAVEVERRFIPAKGRFFWALACILIPVGLLFPPAFREECILRVLYFLPDLLP